MLLVIFIIFCASVNRAPVYSLTSTYQHSLLISSKQYELKNVTELLIISYSAVLVYHIFKIKNPLLLFPQTTSLHVYYRDRILLAHKTLNIRIHIFCRGVIKIFYMLERLVIGLRPCKSAINILTLYCIVVMFKPIACFRANNLNISNEKTLT
jgi:hypothetical protein